MTRKTPSLDQFIEEFILSGITEGKSPKTSTWYRANLTRFSRYIDDQGLPRQVTEIGTSEARHFIFHLQHNVRRWQDSVYVHDDKGLSALSVQGYARSIKAFWSYLLAEGYISTNPMAKLKLPKAPQKIIPTFTPDQIQKMLSVIDRKKHCGFRTYAITLLLLDTGIRLSELVNLDMDRIDFEQSCFIVTGKGNKERLVPFGSQVSRTLRHYATYFRPEPDSIHCRQLFLSEQGLPLKPRLVQSTISLLGKRAGISGIRCSPHTFRHTFAKQYLLQGGDIFSLQRILGHSSLEVVKVYINLTLSEISGQHHRYSPVDSMSGRWQPKMTGYKSSRIFNRLALSRVSRCNSIDR